MDAARTSTAVNSIIVVTAHTSLTSVARSRATVSGCASETSRAGTVTWSSRAPKAAVTATTTGFGHEDSAPLGARKSLSRFAYGPFGMRRASLLVLATVVALVGVLGVVPVGAHEEVPGIRNVVASVEPALPDGVTFDVVISAADQVVVTNTTDQVLEVPGADGEPFLRIDQDGVAANFRSPTWHRTLNPDEGGVLPPEADARADPRFVRVSQEPSWGWFDHRLHEVSVRTAPAVEPGATVVLQEWSIPFRVGDVEHVATGRREYSRPTGAFVATTRSVPDGLEATVLGGLVPAIAVVRAGAETVEVLGRDGEVFARLGEVVEVDVRSEEWRLTTAVRDTGEPPVVPDGSSGADFVRYDAGGQLVWLETRAVHPEEVPPPGVSDIEPTVVLRWRVPVIVDGRRRAIEGVTSWVPDGASVAEAGAVDGGGDVPAWVLPLAIGASVTGAALVLLRRRLGAAT